MGTDTTPDPELLAEIAAALLNARFGDGPVERITRRTVEEALAPAVMEVVARYVAAKTAAEREAGETRTEWGVRRGDEEDEEMSFYGEAEQAAREFAAYPPVEGYRVEKRTVHTSPWVPVEDEAGA